ncbi:MAG TPA: efflux RND transporter periplasmic adaptor subunit [Thermoguttaceae bacterium]|nr:efflux RND transporter periplasmic adaptor subunit [Thermoguttaceae bacterium]
MSLSARITTVSCGARAIWVCLAVLAAPGCGSHEPSHAEKTPPAKVARPADEQDLATITLTEKAEKRLGIFTVEVEKKPVPRRRTLGGEVISPPGQTVAVSAPVSGTLAGPNGNGVPPPGARVTRGAPIFTLLPLAASERSVLTSAELVQMAQSLANLETLRTEAKQQAALGEIQVEAAKIALDRAEQLLRDQAGSRQAVDEAKAQSDLTKNALETARERLALLEKTKLDADTGNLRPLTISAPVTGVLSSFGAVSGELVVAGKILFEVISQDRVWVRVPVYVGQWADVDAEKMALVTELGRPSDAPPRTWTATPIAAPPSANPAAATVDLFYELGNEGGHFRPGHKVAVTLPLEGEVKSLVVPWSAVLHDFHGGTWVYEEIAPQTFVRRRVHVRFVSGAEAVLADGLEPGTLIVTDGAAELFGTEFGFGK